MNRLLNAQKKYSPMVFIADMPMHVENATTFKRDNLTVVYQTTLPDLISDRDNITFINNLFIGSGNNRPHIYTRFQIDDEREGGIAFTSLPESEFNDGYDVVVALNVKKSFKVKARVKSVSRFVPKPSFD